MNRGITLAVPGLALATVGGVWAEVRRAANAPLPRFADHDPSGRYGIPGGPAVHLAVLGDSSCTGPGLEHPSQVWVAELCAGLDRDVQLASYAKGGSRAADLLRDQLPAAAASRPDLFVVAVGANDVMHLTPARQYEAQLHRLLSELQQVAPVVSLGIGDLSVIPRVPRSLRSALARRCMTFDRVHERVSNRLDGVLRVPVAELSDPHFRRMRREIFVADLFHPNHAGHRLWAELFRSYVHASLRSGVPA